MLHSATVTSKLVISPGHDGSVTDDGSKGLMRGLDLLDIPQLLLHRTAVATEKVIAPSHHRSIAQDGSKRLTRGLDLLNIVEPMLHSSAIATESSVAQVTTDPSAKIAANALPRRPLVA